MSSSKTRDHEKLFNSSVVVDCRKDPVFSDAIILINFIPMSSNKCFLVIESSKHCFAMLFLATALPIFFLEGMRKYFFGFL